MLPVKPITLPKFKTVRVHAESKYFVCLFEKKITLPFLRTKTCLNFSIHDIQVLHAIYAVTDI